MPENEDGRVLVHIGCGRINAPGFINIDAVALAHVHIPTDDIADLSCFADRTVDLVYMCHVLEHVRRPVLGLVLKEIHRILKPGGVLRLSVPDFDRLVDIYQAAGRNIEKISRQLMGGQDDEYNIHYCVFNRPRLSGLLNEAGFPEIREWDPRDCRDHDFKDKADRHLAVDGEKRPISLNLEAVKG